ncbi:MAG: signal transduction histidine kinase, nitrogen specific [Peptococcaceae bacterium]|nr:signal transduction histidine kinase, nitrogen specific [Peptococcaceae bacterium]
MLCSKKHKIYPLQLTKRIYIWLILLITLAVIALTVLNERNMLNALNIILVGFIVLVMLIFLTWHLLKRVEEELDTFTKAVLQDDVQFRTHTLPELRPLLYNVRKYTRELEDINQRLNSEIARRQLTEEELDHFFNLSLDILCIIGFDGYIKRVNPAFQRLLGYDRDDLTGRRLRDFVYPEDGDSTFRQIEKLGSGSHITHFENRLVCKDGVLKWISWNAVPVTGRGIFYAVGRDISEQKRTEQVLAEQTRFLELVFKHTHTGLAIMDRNFNFIRVNEVYASYDKRDSSQFPGHNHFEFYPDDEVRAIFEKVVLSKEPFQVKARPFIYPHHPERGVTYWDWFLVPVLDAAGEVELLIFSLNNVTDQKRAEESLRRSEDQLRLITDALPVMIAYVDAGETYRYNNKMYEEWFGQDRSEMYGKHIKEVLGETYETIREHVAKALAGEQVTFEYILHRKGEPCYVRTTYIPHRGEEGKVQGFFAKVTDITEQKQLEKDLVRYEKMNLVGQMAAGVAHEIRNPMTTVYGFLQLFSLKQEFSSYRHYFKLMLEELNRANNIIGEFLSLAKSKPIYLIKENLNTIIESLLPLLQASAMHADKYIEVELGEIPEVCLNDNEIRQLILNLVRNGLEAMEPGGRLTVTTFREREEIVLAVKDEGKGIDSEILEHIGTPFFTTKEKGTGLGLAVCYSIAQRHKAVIKIDTGPAGTTFFVRFKSDIANHEKSMGIA